jgi:hypothetical protein
MTDPERSRPSDDGGAADSRAEQVLAQALRVMAGGGKAPGQPSGSTTSRARRLTTGQLILLAAIVGLLIGICAGFLSLML